MFFRLLALASFALAMLANGQKPNPDTASPSQEAMSSFQAVNASIDTILQQYEQLTGKVLIKDSNLAANAVPISISVPQPVPRAELVRLIEAALLLNNYALIPGPEPNTVKVININTGKNPRSEGVHLYTTLESLPEGEQVVSFYMPLKYISANEALTVFQTHILPRAYTSFVPINSAQAILITETTSVLRQLIALQQLIDIPPTRTVTEFVQLIRADAEKVADTINKLLQAEQKGPSGQPSVPVVPQPPSGQGQPNVGEGSGLGQLIADTRTNRVLIVARPENVAYLRNLVEDFDKAAISARPLEYRLRYVSAGDVLPVLAQVLAENAKEAEGIQGGQNPQNPQQPQNRENRQVNFGGAGMGSSSLSGGAYGGGGQGYGSNIAESLLQEPNQPAGPQALVVGKTRIISDSRNNKILVIGPPESIQRIRSVLDQLDRRPQQVYLATVIGQLQLTNDLDFGIDFTQTFKKLGGGNGVASANQNSPITTAGSIIDPRSILTTGAFPANAVGGLTIYGSITDAIRVFIRATETHDRFRILARPSVYTANNKLAVISNGQQIPYPGSTLTSVQSGNTGIISNNTTNAVASTVEFANVELRLEVIPLINSDGEVTLKIAQVNDSAGAPVNISGNPVPEINSQRLTTTVTVPSGATVVLGGLIQDQHTTTESGIPYLMRVPYLGNLFKYHTQDHKRTELLVFIQPVVVNNDHEAVAQSVREERRTHVAPDTYPLAHPDTDVAAPQPTAAQPRPRKKKGYYKE
jgi:general secretion pathway protein D